MEVLHWDARGAYLVHGLKLPVRTCISNHIYCFILDIITHPCPNFTGLSDPASRCQHVYVHILLSPYQITLVVRIGHVILPTIAWSMKQNINQISLTHLSLDKMAAISHTTFKHAFSRMKCFVFRSEFHWSLFLRVQLTIRQQWLR